MSIENIYSNLAKRLETSIVKSKKFALDESLTHQFPASESSIVREGFANYDISLENQDELNFDQPFGVRELVRPGFGKHGRLITSFGCHPDFLNMDDGELRNGYSVTMFMDIIGSTKLGVMFEPQIVYRIKNDIIRCAIETVEAFDGHVHRIMGDAVMAFFRSNRCNDEGRVADSAIDALNCATYLIEMFKSVVIPRLVQMGVDENIGIRIGLDYGKDEEVVWGRYGHMQSNEVTATSFYVDVAAKLQQKAPKNCIMVGAGFVNLLGLDENFIKRKKITKDGGTQFVEYLTPNYKDASGKTINYDIYVFKNKAYYPLLPAHKNINSLLTVSATLKKDKSIPSEDYYFQCSRVIRKGVGISFKGTFASSYPYDNPRFRFKVVNTGKEASLEEGNGNHVEYVDAALINGKYQASRWEDTAYKGIHHMYVSFMDGEQVISTEECFSVFVSD